MLKISDLQRGRTHRQDKSTDRRQTSRVICRVVTTVTRGPDLCRKFRLSPQYGPDERSLSEDPELSGSSSSETRRSAATNLILIPKYLWHFQFFASLMLLLSEPWWPRDLDFERQDKFVGVDQRKHFLMILNTHFYRKKKREEEKERESPGLSGGPAVWVVKAWRHMEELQMKSLQDQQRPFANH